MSGEGTKRAVAGHSWGPVPVSTHGMRTFDADVGSRLRGLFLADGFGTGCEVGSTCMRHNTEPTRIIERVMRGGEIDVRKFAEGALSRIRLRAFVLRRAAPS